MMQSIYTIVGVTRYVQQSEPYYKRQVSISLTVRRYPNYSNFRNIFGTIR